MMMHNIYKALGLSVIVAGAAATAVSAGDVSEVPLPGDRAFPESVAAASDGTLYVSSIASGGVWRIKPGSGTAEEWVKPGAFGSRVTLGVNVDEKQKIVWVCSNDMSALGVPGPSDVKGAHLLGFDLATGEGKVSTTFPGEKNFCNDTAIGADGTLYIANSASPQILTLKPGSSNLEVWLESKDFEQPADGGAGLDGIAFGADGNLYLNTFATGLFFRVDVKDGKPGKVTKLTPSRALKNPDGLRPTGGNTFVMAEGGGTVDRVTIKGDDVEIETIKELPLGPTGVMPVGDKIWVTEGQLSHLFNAKSGPPHLPFRVLSIPAK